MSGERRPPKEDGTLVPAATVSGVGETEVLERILIDLGALAQGGHAAGILSRADLTAIEVVALSKPVTITECEVFANKVLVSGVLHEDLLFKFKAATSVSEALLTANDCALTLTEPLNLAVDCRFTAWIRVPGACPGDTCLIEKASVEAEKERLIDTDRDSVADQFEETVCISIKAKTVRTRQISLSAGQVHEQAPPDASDWPRAQSPPPSFPGGASSVFITRRLSRKHIL